MQFQYIPLGSGSCDTMHTFIHECFLPFLLFNDCLLSDLVLVVDLKHLHDVEMRFNLPRLSDFIFLAYGNDISELK